MSSYQFRRDDDGEVVEVDFETAMTMDVLGCITLPDGTQARKVRDTQKATVEVSKVDKPIVSDSLGFVRTQLAEFEEDRKRNGFGVEFVPDPSSPEFVQVKCRNVKEFERYAKHRGFFDKNRHGGAALSPELWERGAKRILEQHAAHV